MKRKLILTVLFVIISMSTSFADERSYPHIDFDDPTNIYINTPEYGGVKTKFNLYFDYEYTKMEKMPMPMGVAYMEMDEQEHTAVRHLNFLGDFEKGAVRAHFNFEAQNLYTSGDDDGRDSTSRMMEYYLESTLNDAFKVRAGKFLAPFGIYNDIRYITPLYATVVLPTIYAAPMGYSGGAFYPPDANAMFSGVLFPTDDIELYYAAYYGTGEKDDKGMGFNATPSTGGRVKATLHEMLTLGVSGFTFDNDVVGGTGQEDTIGADLELLLLDDDLTIQAEHVKTGYNGIKDRSSRYVRVMYKIDRFTPFVMFDRINDREDSHYKHKLERWGYGLSVRLTNNVYLKGEYHRHKFIEGDVKTMAGKDISEYDMVKAALNFAF